MIYIVRHGQTDWNLQKRIQGVNDIPLNSTGRQQAAKARDALSDISFDLVFASPLSRAKETAFIITGSTHIIIDPRLTEKGNGKFEGMLVEEVKKIRSTPGHRDADYSVESSQAVQARVKNFCDDVLKKHPDKNILIATHGGTGIRFRCLFEGEPRDGDYGKLLLGNGEFICYKNY